MYQSQPTTHQFSPQRRQILGATGRLSPKKATLGTGTNTKEAINIGPKKLFGDLKQQSAGKNVASSSRTGKSRAFGEKTNQSPSRPNDNSSPAKQTSKQLPSTIFTPPTNVGQAGAMRWRMGELMDAMKDNEGELSNGQGENATTSDGQQLTEDELYPEIEYMPPTADYVQDFPSELDGLPRGAEMGEMLKSIQTEGFYRPTRPESIELQRQQDLEDVPDPDTEKFIAKMWPKEGYPSNTSMVRKGTPLTIKSTAQTITKPAISTVRKPLQSQTASRLAINKAAPLKSTTLAGRTPITSLQNRSSVFVAKSKQDKEREEKQLLARRKVLGVKNSNAQSANAKPIRKGKSNAELLDFDNDAMGKQVEKKLRRIEEAEKATKGFEGFVL